MKILVAGGAGFLGSHLCEFLLDKSHEVICVDNFYTGNYDNLNRIIKHPKFQILHNDITFPMQLEVDAIYNLACPASPIHYQRNPVQTIKSNVHGSINLLELAKKNQARILQASTSEIYGDPEIHPQKEEYWGKVNPIGLRSCYDEGKRCAETLFFDYHRQYSVEIKVARIFNTYGPRMQEDDGRVVSNLIVQALRNQDISVYGDGNQTRSFCYVDDLIYGLFLLMESPVTVTGPINLGNPNEISIFNLANLIIEITNSKSKIILKELPKDDPKRRNPDISQANKILRWEPKIQLIEGLERTTKYFQKKLNV